MSRNVHVAIIDDGVSEKELGARLLYDVEINTKNSAQKRESQGEGISHGTLCAAIVLHYNNHVKISSVKVLNENLKGHASRLYVALKWCLDHDVDVASISLGSTLLREKSQMQKVINHVVQDGLIIVCASHNDGYITYPASFSNVLSVRCDRANSLSRGEYILHPRFVDGIDCTAFARHELNFVRSGAITCSNSNSYAAPMITAHVSRILKNITSPSIDMVKEELMKYAKNKNTVQSMTPSNENPDWITGAIIFTARKKFLSKAAYYFLCVNETTVSSHTNVIKQIEKQLQASKKGWNTIIIDDLRLDEEIMHQLNRLAALHHKSLVYIGESQVELPSSPQDKPLKIWHWSYKRQIIERAHYTRSPIDAPTVFIFLPDDLDILYILHIVKLEFMEDGYNCMAITEQPEAVLYNLEYLPHWCMKIRPIETASYLRSYIKKSNADICIGAFRWGCRKEIREIGEMLEQDMVINVLSKNGAVEITVHITGQASTAPLISKLTDDSVAKTIVQYLKTALV